MSDEKEVKITKCKPGFAYGYGDEGTYDQMGVADETRIIDDKQMAKLKGRRRKVSRVSVRWGVPNKETL